MELLISEIVAQNLYRDVKDVVQKAFTVLIRSNILQKTEYSINPQMTRTELVPPNKTKSTTNDMHRQASFFTQLYLKNSLTSFFSFLWASDKLIFGQGSSLVLVCQLHLLIRQVLSLTRIEQGNNNNTRQTSSLKTTMAQGRGLNANLNSSLFFVLDSHSLLAKGNCLLVAHCS